MIVFCVKGNTHASEVVQVWKATYSDPVIDRLLPDGNRIFRRPSRYGLLEFVMSATTVASRKLMTFVRIRLDLQTPLE